MPARTANLRAVAQLMLETLRALPDARCDRAAKTWTMPLHRAEAIAVRAIIARSEAVAGNLPRIKGSIEQRN